MFQMIERRREKNDRSHTSFSDIAPEGIGRYGSLIASISRSYQSLIVYEVKGKKFMLSQFQVLIQQTKFLYIQYRTTCV